MKLYAIIQRTDLHPASRHFMGLPAALRPAGAEPEPLEWPRVVIIDVGPGGVFLDRFGDDGSSVGDTWHQSLDDAKAQAVAEYDGALGEWAQVPTEVDDETAVEYVLAKAWDG